MENKKIVGIWIRVSTEDQAKGESPEHHEKRARLYAEAKGWEVREVYRLEAVSGKSVKEHYEAKRMLSDIAKGNITGLIFSKLARLARNTKELLEFADIFRECNADLISLQESIDTSTPAGRLFYTMIAAMAQWEREEIAERIAASVPVRAKLGKNLGGQASLGYKWVDNKLVVDEKEAPIRILMYETFLEVRRKRTTAEILNKKGYRMRSGALFTESAVERLIRNSTAKGQHVSNYTKSVNGEVVLKPKSDWVILPCPAIISEELWATCNRILDEQYKSRKGPRAVHLLAGYVTCTCGNKMYVYHGTANYTCKQCKRRIPVADIDAIYHEQLKTFLLTDTDVAGYLEKTDQTIIEKESLLKTITEKVSQLRKRMDELVTMRLNHEMSPENFKVHYKPLEEQVAQMENQIPELMAEIDFLKINHQSSDVVLQGARDLYQRWPTLPFEEKRSIVETITEKIVVDSEDIHLSLSYLPTTHPFQNAGKNPQSIHALEVKSPTSRCKKISLYRE
ncbi:MAG: recombinase family protein [Bacteroidota bacterium]